MFDSLTMPIVWPAPFTPAWYSGPRSYCVAKSSGVTEKAYGFGVP